MILFLNSTGKMKRRENDMSSAGVNLSILIQEAMDNHSAQDGCPWKEGAWKEAVLSPEFAALEKKLKKLEICND